MHARTAVQEAWGSDEFMVIQGRAGGNANRKDTADGGVPRVPRNTISEDDSSALAGTSFRLRKRDFEA